MSMTPDIAKRAVPIETTPESGLWHRLFQIHVSFIPLPVYIVLCVLVASIVAVGKVGTDLMTMIAIIGLGGATCAEIGKRIPYLNKIGGAAIISAFLPSYLVSIGWVPDAVTTSVTSFTKSSNFIYLFVSSVVVGSIFTMDRDMIIKGFAKIFLPLMVGSILAFVTGGLVGMAAGLDLKQVLFFVSVPVMGGGLGEGAIPLSVGYGEVMGIESGKVLAQVLPIILLANLFAIVLCGVMSAVGKRFPHLTGNGRLQVGESGPELATKAEAPQQGLNIEWVIAAGMSAVTLYLAGVLLHQLFGLPGPVCMLFLAVLLKLCNGVPKRLEEGSRTLFKFFMACVTYPLLFANSIAVTHWHELISAFHVANLLAIFTTVLTLILVGFAMARRLGLHPVEAGIVNGCHSGLGGTGDVAILTAAGRMELMPFAQIATRIGGAITVMAALLIFAHVGP
ncbi:2-hydroxycarboxylate transporter family protein [Pseudomonas sp. S31]|uniref:2-hydroxycarboxylate transporter family protein n=1 Tax=Pseudomonas sp. S31 TaxID=1564473 RepID=UPI00191175F1|nr:2-hydroxycarboxylate transporter family protein [Pseudomonas sp. S31]MBK5000240.1 2-hydroxycarboxylate transporter family protein [Pseudomonas sp. S31]